MAKAKFSGEYIHSLDAKGRVIVPVRHRAFLGEEFVIARGLDHCLYIYNSEDWDELVEKMETLPDMFSPAGRQFKRFFIGSSVPSEIDKQGRVLIPQPLRDHAKLTKEVLLVGVGNRIEVWDKAAWDEYNMDIDMDAVTAQLGASGFVL